MSWKFAIDDTRRFDPLPEHNHEGAPATRTPSDHRIRGGIRFTTGIAPPFPLGIVTSMGFLRVAVLSRLAHPYSYPDTRLLRSGFDVIPLRIGSAAFIMPSTRPVTGRPGRFSPVRFRVAGRHDGGFDSELDEDRIARRTAGLPFWWAATISIVLAKTGPAPITGKWEIGDGHCRPMVGRTL